MPLVLVAMPLLVAMPFVTSCDALAPVAMPFVTSIDALAPSTDALCY